MLLFTENNFFKFFLIELIDLAAHTFVKCTLLTFFVRDDVIVVVIYIFTGTAFER